MLLVFSSGDTGHDTVKGSLMCPGKGTSLGCVANWFGETEGGLAVCSQS